MPSTSSQRPEHNTLGFFHFGAHAKPTSTIKGGLSIELLHRQGCKVCPLNAIRANRHPHIEPLGTARPLVYMLGSAPTASADRRDVPFAGEAYELLRMRLPRGVDKITRWNNVVRTATPDGRAPEEIEVECCRPSVTADIEQSKPRAIFGFGEAPLRWATEFTGIRKWSGRKLPVRIGTHTCWYFAFEDPDMVLEKRRFTPRGKGYGCEEEFALALELDRAFASIDTLPEPVIHTPDEVMADTEIVVGGSAGDVDRVKAFVEATYAKKLVGFDYETNRLRPYNKGSKLLTAALSTNDGTMAFALEHKQAGWSSRQRDQVYRVLEDFLYEAPVRKVVHQLAFEMEWSAVTFGRDVLRAQPWGDSVSQAFLLDARMQMNKPDCHSLEFLCKQYFGFNLKALSNMDTAALDDAPVEQVLRYNAPDAKYHRLLYRVQDQRLKNEGLHDVYEQHLERIPTCVLTQIKGVPVDQSVVDEFYDKYTAECDKYAEQIKALPVVKQYERKTGKPYRLSAAQDLGHIITKTLGLELAGKKKAGQVDETALEKIDHPIAKLTLKWKKPAKLLSTYIVPVRVKPSKLPGGDRVTSGSPHIYVGSKMHPIISTTRVVNWRTSSEDPNSQNWPKRQNRQIRRQIRARSGYKIVSFDFGQIQARNVAMESLDKALVQAFWDRYDIHADWTHRIVSKCPKWIKEGTKVLASDPKLFKWYRDRTKNQLVFPSFFGAQPYSLAKYLEIPESVCAELYEEFWDMFPDVRVWHKSVEKQYREDGYVTGLTGFRRRAPITANEMINSPIQADESVIVLDAMTRLSKLGWEYQASMEIHDDLTFHWPIKKIEQYSEVVIREMLTTPFEWAHCVPLVVEMSVGDDWATQVGVGDFASDLWSGMEPNKGAWADGTGWQDHDGMRRALVGEKT